MRPSPIRAVVVRADEVPHDRRGDLGQHVVRGDHPRPARAAVDVVVARALLRGPERLLERVAARKQKVKFTGLTQNSQVDPAV